MEGASDHYLWESDSSFPYSYHDRIFNYSPYSLEDSVHVNYDLEFVDNNFVKKHKKLLKSGKIQASDDSII